MMMMMMMMIPSLFPYLTEPSSPGLECPKAGCCSKALRKQRFWCPLKVSEPKKNRWKMMHTYYIPGTYMTTVLLEVRALFWRVDLQKGHCFGGLTLWQTNIAMENPQFSSRKYIYKWWNSIAILVYWSVYILYITYPAIPSRPVI